MSTDLIFISYSPKDADKALSIANKLKGSGANIWIDSLNLLNMPAGEDADDFTESAIKSSKLFLIITSNHALKNESLKQEKECARENNVERLLLKIEECDTSKFRWKSLRTIDLYKNEVEGFKLLLNKLNIENTFVSNVIEENNPVSLGLAASPIREQIPEPAKKIEPIQRETAMPQGNGVNSNDLLEELMEDFEVYKYSLKNQIGSGYYGFGALLCASAVLLAGLYAFNGLKEVLDYTQKNFKYLTTIGGFLPSTFSTFSYSKIKENKKRLQGVDYFERQISRMQRGIIPSSKEHILSLEDEFIKYIKA